MTSAASLIKQEYQVIRLTNGQELVGMVRDRGNYIQITLPMICHLSVSIPENGKVGTIATFFPYSAMSSDPIIELPKSIVSHWNALNTQFIPLYDKASSEWLHMIENKTIPLLEKSSKQRTQKIIENEIERLMETLDYDLEFNGHEESESESFLKMTKPKDGKIH